LTNRLLKPMMVKIYMLPVFILFLLIQKNIQKGMLFTDLHG